MRPITAADVMNPRVLAAAADWTLPELADFLVEHQISGAPVVDPTGRLLGVVSVTDLAAALAQLPRAAAVSDFFQSAWPESPDREALADLQARGERRTVREIMTPHVYTVTEDTPVGELALTLIEEHVHRLLVTRAEQVVGIVSTSDLLGLLVAEEE
ncbi:MAG TPA: CBS domain-containing protein [Thermoanaerobaculia bacterium]|nr:CBS domain-containing protein [Thermoanaerobaculia bacterium]